jgi:hypothetical protein
MPQDYPDHHDADLVLRLYELRREAVMRESRASINAKFWPKTLDDMAEVFKPEHPLNAAYRQVGSYWEMVYSMARYGVINPDFLLESSGEGIFFYARVHPFLQDIRAARGPRQFLSAEWITTNSKLGAELLAGALERVTQTLATR